MLLGVAAIGGIAAGLCARVVLRHLTYQQVMSAMILMQALGWFGVASAGEPRTVAAFLAVIGACGALASIAVAAARQELTPDDLTGRVVTTFRFVGFGASGVGGLVGGLVAAEYGLAAPLVAAGLLLMVTSVSSWPWCGPSLPATDPDLTPRRCPRP